MEPARCKAQSTGIEILATSCLRHPPINPNSPTPSTKAGYETSTGSLNHARTIISARHCYFCYSPLPASPTQIFFFNGVNFQNPHGFEDFTGKQTSHPNFQVFYGLTSSAGILFLLILSLLLLVY
jgi:hypothetical protein